MNTKNESITLEKSTLEAASCRLPEKKLTFADAAQQYIEKKNQESAGRNPAKQARRLKQNFNTYCLSALGNILMSHLETSDIAQALEPIWAEKPLVAERVRQTIHGVCEHARSNGVIRLGHNPAIWRDNLDRFLVKSKTPIIRSAPSLSYQELPRFLSLLKTLDTIPAKALEFQLLTAARPGEVRAAKWEEIDLDKKIWAIPGWKIKGRKSNQSHEIPLTNRAIEILTTLPRSGGESLFLGSRGKKMINENTLNLTVKKIHHLDVKNGGPGFFDPASGGVATAHGMRRTFRDFAIKKTGVEDHVVVLALSKFDRSSSRGVFTRAQLIPKRRKLMNMFERYSYAWTLANGLPSI